jgi:hypothetical protein
MSTCNGNCTKPKIGSCACGMFRDGVMVGNGTIRVPLMLTDSAPPSQERKPLPMMTDSEKQSMRDRVPTMTVDQASALPIYDNLRGKFAGGMPAEKYYALCDGAKPSEMTADQHKVEAARDHAAWKMASAWRAPQNDNRPITAPQIASDGRPMSELTDSERAREQMIANLENAHKN